MFGQHLVILTCLAVFTVVLLAWIYNHLLLSSFNSSLALSRRVPVQMVNYLFIILLALIVNLCLRFIGALLINALLIIPAATAVNLSQNMRQLFRRTIGLTLLLSVSGQWLSWEMGQGGQNLAGHIRHHRPAQRGGVRLVDRRPEAAFPTHDGVCRAGGVSPLMRSHYRGLTPPARAEIASQIS